MKLDVERVSLLPSYAWVAVMHKRSSSAAVFAGPAVDITDDAVVEGAWNGSFSGMEFDAATLFAGSGIVCRGPEVIFCTASHTFERLLSIRRGDELWISNSLVLILATSGAMLKPGYLDYDSDLRSFIRGLSNRVRAVPLANGEQLRSHYVSTIRVRSDLELIEAGRPSTPDFQDFDDYWVFLRDEFRRIVRNASDPQRTRPVSPLATISSGYDSPATAVLARSCGADSAVTFTSGRENFGSASDSGEELGGYIGLDVETFDRLAYLSRADYPEAEFLATGAGGGDVVISALEQSFRDRCVFTGFLGDTLWALNHPDPRLSTDFQFKYPGGGSLSEFRLRVGFVHLPVPLMTLRSHESISRISNSPELRPWCVGVEDYDRPIPRRIVESEGVPRELFGQNKNAVNQPFFQAMFAGRMLSPASRRDLHDFWAGGADGRLRPAGILARSSNRWFVESGLADRTRARLRRTRFAARFEPGFNRIRQRSASGACFHWGLSRAIRRIPVEALTAIEKRD